MKLNELFETQSEETEEFKVTKCPYLQVGTGLDMEISMITTEKFEFSEYNKLRLDVFSGTGGNGEVDIKFNDNIDFTIRGLKWEVASDRKKQIEIEKHFEAIINNALKGITEVNRPHTVITLICSIFPPKEKLSADIVHLKLPQKDISFSKINDHIQYCQKLRITNISKITDSVLGLLRIKGLKTPIIHHLVGVKGADPGKTMKWVETINKYISSGDVLECQEDLIDAGLKDYAKL